ncbi:MAG: N-acetylmuramic acid 6-phosphate etherase [Cytophagaceae bacterium]
MSGTEASSGFDNLEKMTVSEILKNINQEDQTVPKAVNKALPQIEKLVTAIIPKIKSGGRLFYIGAGTSGRLGILDASECPPSYGVPGDMVIGIIAGGDKAIRHAVEFAEDDTEQGWKDLLKFNISTKDCVIGIAASGKTPYVVSVIDKCRNEGIVTGCITCNKDSILATKAQFPIEVETGPEFVTGSTRMKAGTAQKLVLNMISTTLMVQLGRVKGNKMVDMQLTNKKLFHRGIKIITEELNIDHSHAETLLQTHGSVRKAIEFFRKNA